MDLRDVETELRAHLADRPVPPAPEGLVQRTRVLHRRRRRHQAALAGAGLAVALLVGSVPVLRDALPDVPGSDVAAPPSAAQPSLYDLPVRGSLAGDAGWLEEVAALPWTAVPEADPDTDPPSGSHRVLYAADVPGGRVALVMGAEGAVLSAAWFVGPPGAEPTELTQAAPAARAYPDQPLTLLDAPDATGPAVLVVVSRPGDEATYTQGHLVSATGEETDDVVQVELDDGAGSAEVVSPSVFPGYTEVRVERDGEQAYSLDPGLSDRSLDAELAVPVDVADPRGLRAGDIDEEWLRGLTQSALSRYGSGADGVTPVLLAAGAAAGAGDPHVLMIGLTFPSGATTVWAVRYVTTEGSSSGTTTSLPPAPAGVPLPEQALGVRVAGALAVSAPARAAAAEALAADGTVVAAFPLVDGTAVAELPLTPPVTDVRVLDTAGSVVAQVRVTGTNG